MAKAKYKTGKKICSISEFDACEKLWYKWRGRTVHRSMLISQQYRTLLNWIISGMLYEAEYIDEGDKQCSSGCK